MIDPIAEEAPSLEAPPPQLARQRSATYRARWTSCCIQTDRGAVVYLGQMCFAGALIALCAVMLVKANGDCSVSSPYISLLSFLAGKILSSVADSSH